MNTSNTKTVFDYRLLRLVMGLVAFALPILVSVHSSSPLSSISASYHTEARDIFVGSLFCVATFLFAYNGHTTTEARVSNAACIAAVLVALFPTACDGCASNAASNIHYLAAAILFGILAYFCLFPLRWKTKGQTGKKRRRDIIYVSCGWVIIGCIVSIGLTKLTTSAETLAALHFTYWVEFLALWAFGIAWVVAGKVLPPLVDDDERLKFKLFGE